MQVNNVQAKVTESLLFVTVCFPMVLIFVFVLLPVNWIVVVSAGMLEYFDSGLLRRNQMARELVSRAIGYSFTPLLLAWSIIVVPAGILLELSSHVETWQYKEEKFVIDPTTRSTSVHASSCNFG
ncbi:hypothetical protein T484DRAFT_1790862 [Baffinella frigidus]|nr:hypothetical protein T484DRAFT_1790862 [Cryptophyta sp. CCMP2293]